MSAKFLQIYFLTSNLTTLVTCLYLLFVANRYEYHIMAIIFSLLFYILLTILVAIGGTSMSVLDILKNKKIVHTIIPTILLIVTFIPIYE